MQQCSFIDPKLDFQSFITADSSLVVLRCIFLFQSKSINLLFESLSNTNYVVTCVKKQSTCLGLTLALRC